LTEVIGYVGYLALVLILLWRLGRSPTLATADSPRAAPQ
jgi:hypothetical protein